jgi:hypothetical protein
MNTRFAGSDSDLHALAINTLAQLGLGATGLYGTAAGGIPAVMMMRDQEQPQHS